MSVSIKLSKEEAALAESYCNEHSIPIDEAFKRAFFEMLEDEHDARIAQEAYEEHLKSGKKSRPIEELWKELGL